MRKMETESLFEEIISIIVIAFHIRGEIWVSSSQNHKFPNNFNSKISPRYIKTKLSEMKDTEKNLKARKNKHITCEETFIGYQRISQQRLCRPEREG